MCGIAGIIKFKDSGIDAVQAAISMNNTIRHRGPDGEGFLVISASNEISLYGKDTPQEIITSSIPHRPVKSVNECTDAIGILAHRRLKIIDITPTGHQPMCNADKSLWITYNGEIYNYIELREDLKKDGYAFLTSSDTEVILAAYEKWGSDCVNHFNGMWAFVIYDKKKKTLFASRDRFGVKPFYYIKNENCFAFASEQKALLASGLVKFKPNDKAIFDYLVFSEMEAEEEGMFTNIYELFPSYSMTVDLETNELKKWKYYTLPYSNKFEDKELDLDFCQEKILAQTLEAIWIRLRSDVEIGCCLSGGLDSSSIVSSIYELRNAAKNPAIETSKMLPSSQGTAGNVVNTFTASFDDGKIDESNWAKIVSDYTHSNAHYVKPDSKGLLRDLHDLIYCQDIPIWSTSTYAQFSLMRLIKENGIKVVLDGQGGDELFAGYDKYFPYYLREMGKHGRSSEVILNRKYQQLNKFLLKQAVLNKYIHYLPLSLQLKTRLKIHPELKYLNRDFLKRNLHRLKGKKDARTLNEALNKDFNNTLLKTYLKCEDRCSMWHSVESRTPFSDDVNLIEYVFSLPSSVKIRNGELKSLLRKAMRGITPDAILDRKDKKGYVTPNRKWIAEIRNEVRYIFETPIVKEYINTKKLLKDYDKLFNQPIAEDNGRIFKLIAFPMWLTIFSKKT